MSDQDDIARRVADSIPADMDHADTAAQIGITAEVFAETRNGHRPLSSIEIVLLGETLDVSDHWLVTGNPEPYRLADARRKIIEPGQRR